MSRTTFARAHLDPAMSECSVLEAALRHNPLFFLASPSVVKKQLDAIARSGPSAAAAAAAEGPSGENSDQPSSVAGASAEPESAESPPESAELAQQSAEHAGRRVAEEQCSSQAATSTRSLSRRERKRRKLKALLDLVLHNDATKPGAETEDVPPEKRSRLETPAPAAGQQAESVSEQSGSADYRHMKNTVRRKRRKQRLPEFQLSLTGDHASLVMAAHSRTPLFLRDVQTLLLNAVVPDHAPWPTRWCNLLNADRVTRTVAVVVDGLSLRDLQTHSDVMKSTLTLFPHQVELISPAHYGTSVAEEILNVPLSMTQKHRLVQQLGSLDGAVQAGLIHRQWGDDSAPGGGLLPLEVPRPAAVGRTALLLDVSQLMEEGCPLPGAGRYSRAFQGFVPTKDKYKPVTDQSPMFSVDCEMCLTREGSELTSISVLNESEELVYGTLVKPENPITDYLTRWSGITAEKLEGVTTRLADVQQDLRNLLPADAILIGQSFNNDLRALQMMHPYIIDTSVIYNITGNRSKKTKLSLLSYMFLGEIIQDDVEGHDATEDALAALRLVQRKLSRGYTYGDAVQGGYVPAMNSRAGPEAEEGEGDDALPAAVNVDGYYTSLLARMQEVGVTTAIVASGPGTDIYRVACETTNHPSLTLRAVPSNRQACDGAIAALPSADLTLCHMELRDRVHGRCPPDRARAHLHRLDKRLRRLYRAAPERSLLVVVCAGEQVDQTGRVENGVCLVAVKQSTNDLLNGAAAENDGDTDALS